MVSGVDSVGSLFPKLGYGAGLRTPHYDHILHSHPSVDFFEAISENFMGIESGSGGKPIAILEKVRANYPVALHGVSLSLGSTDPLNENYLKQLKTLVERIQPAIISDHLCWTGVLGNNLHDLLPLPYTQEAIEHVANRITRVQDILKRRILIENVSSYVTYSHSEMNEWDFLREIVDRADCGILLDVNNIYVSSVNHGFNALDYIRAIPKKRIGQYHLAGYSDHGTHIIDTHDHPVSSQVWELYQHTIEYFGNTSTLLEWDDKIPAFEVLENELNKAKAVERLILGRVATKRSQAPRPRTVDGMAPHRFSGTGAKSPLPS